MDKVFRKLAERLDEVEHWLKARLREPAGMKHERLLRKLERYIRHCRRSKQKWQSIPEAQRTINKLDMLAMQLYFILSRSL